MESQPPGSRLPASGGAWATLSGSSGAGTRCRSVKMSCGRSMRGAGVGRCRRAMRQACCWAGWTGARPQQGGSPRARAGHDQSGSTCSESAAGPDGGARLTLHLPCSVPRKATQASACSSCQYTQACGAQGAAQCVRMKRASKLMLCKRACGSDRPTCPSLPACHARPCGRANGIQGSLLEGLPGGVLRPPSTSVSVVVFSMYATGLNLACAATPAKSSTSRQSAARGICEFQTKRCTAVFRSTYIHRSTVVRCTG